MSDIPKTLAEALAAVQARLPEVKKGETAEVTMKGGGKYKYSYADLADVSAVILPMLGAVGLSWITRPTINDAGKFVLAYELLHVSGESKTGEYPLTGGTAQEIGSAITYARRYALCAVTGVAPAADDDDGASATRAVRDQWEDARPAGPDPEHLRRNFVTNASKAIKTAGDVGKLDDIKARVNRAAEQGLITQDDADKLADELNGAVATLTQSRASDWPETAEPRESA